MFNIFPEWPDTVVTTLILKPPRGNYRAKKPEGRVEGGRSRQKCLRKRSKGRLELLSFSQMHRTRSEII